MLSRPLKVRATPFTPILAVHLLTWSQTVIARNALAQEESEEFSGEFSDPINIHIENDRDGCAC